MSLDENSGDSIARNVSIIETEESHSCEHGEAFIVSTKMLTLNSINPHLVLYFKNLDPIKKMHIWVSHFGWNGGSVNQDRTLKWGWIITPGVPTANHVPVIAGNMNFTSSNQAKALIYKWNGVGDGMTYPGGFVVSEAIFGRGYTPIWSEGIPILGFNDSFGVLLTGEEVGEAVVTMRFYYK